MKKIKWYLYLILILCSIIVGLHYNQIPLTIDWVCFIVIEFILQIVYSQINHNKNVSIHSKQ